MPTLPDLGPTFGALYLGSIVSTVLYGFTSNQAFVYFKKYHHQDAMLTQLLVLGLWVLDSFQVGLMIDISWSYLVKGYADPTALGVLIWSFSVELGITVFVTFIVRSFYMMQLWGLSGRNVFILGPALLFAASQFALGLETSIHMLKEPSIFTVTTKMFQWILGSKCICSVIADILITTGTCYYLHAARTGFSRTNDLINLLSVYTINRGVLAMLWETIVMITFLTMKTNFIFAALHLMLGKLHTASLFALLNQRETLRQTPEPTTYTHLDLSNRPSHGQNSSQDRRNVEVMVTSETIVDHTFQSDNMKSSREHYRYSEEAAAW